MCAARGRRLGFRPDCTTRRPVVLFNRSRSGRGPTLALAPPALGGLERDYSPTSDGHFGWSEPLVAQFEVHALAEPMRHTKFADRVRGGSNRRRLGGDARIRILVRHRLDGVCVARGGLGRRFARSAVTRGFWPVISPRAIVVASMKIHGRGYGCRKFPGRIDADKCGELTAQKFKQLLHLPDVGLPAPIILAELEHARGGGPLFAGERPPN